MEKHEKRINRSLCFAVLISLMVWNPVWAEEAAQKPVESAAATASATLAPSDTTTSALSVATPETGTPASTSTDSTQATPTPSLTESPTPTLTPTFTLTPTPTLTFTPTVTSTPGVFIFSVSPKPDGQGAVHFKWGTTVPADEVFLGVYTSGYRVVRKFGFNKNENQEYLASGEHEYTWDGRDDNKRPMAPGIYLCFIQVNVGKKRYEASGKTEMP